MHFNPKEVYINMYYISPSIAISQFKEVILCEEKSICF